MIKIIPLAHFFFHSFIHASLSLIHSHLISDSEAHLSQFTLSTPVIKLRSLNSLPQLWSLNSLYPTETRRHRPTSRPKPPINLKPTPPSALDPCRRSRQTHFSFVLSLSLSPFLAPIGSHITLLTSNWSIPFRFALIITVYDH